MYLKNLTAFGFKSFAEKTSLDFQRGITAIVGPNGCGKSNIADAVRWVLGEQSAKALRGGEMADVIFNGTESRKPLGVAEVSLTVGGVDGDRLKTAGVELEFDEVTISRRVFRDGGSEYFINKIPCRLKDIQQLFMGTGVGRSSYSIMAQGNITQILSSRPEDRRLVFEEAAGITRFKAQKREALRKLDHTEQNLQRVADLIREVKRQIVSLQRQAGKARRYRQFQAEMQHLDTQLARHEHDLIEEEVRNLERRIEELRAESESCSAEVMRDEAEVRHRRDQLAGIERGINETRQRALELKSEAERHRNRIQFNDQRLQELAELDERSRRDIAEAGEKGRAAEEELAEVDHELAAAEASVERRRDDVEARGSAVGELDRLLREKQAEVANSQGDAFAVAQELSRTRNELNSLELQRQGNTVRLEKLSTEKVQLEEERTGLEVRLREFALESEAKQHDVATRRLSVEERQRRLTELEQHLRTVGEELESLHREQAEKRSRLDVLRQLEASHEGFGSGAQAALRSAAEVLGTFAERIRVPEQYVAAIEAALGHHLEVVLTERPETAFGILADLNENRRGKASIASLALWNGNGKPPGPLLEPEVSARLNGLQCVPALEAVEADAAIAPLLRGLLERTQIVPDLEAATAAWRETRGRFEFVTPRGELLSRHGVFTGGSTNGTGATATSILARKNEIAELERGLSRLHDALDEVSRRKGAAHGERTALQAGLREAQSELREEEVAIATRNGEHKALESALRTLHQKIDTVVFEVQSLAGQQQEGEERSSGLRMQLAELERRETESKHRLDDMNAAVGELRNRREEAGAQLSDGKVALATDEERRNALRDRQAPLRERLEELAQLAAERSREVDGIVERRGRAEAEIAESRGRVEGLQHERDRIGVRLTELTQTRDAQTRGIDERERSVRQRRGHLAEIQEQRGSLDVTVAQQRMAAQNVRDRIQQKYQIDLDDIRGECIRIIYTDSGPAKVERVSPDEMDAAGVSTDWNAVRDQVSALGEKIETMGPVNLVAIEEHEETEQRYNFLDTQHEDLIKAKDQLVEVINRVNKQTREMFAVTFNQIRESFKETFRELFGGGTADLWLVDEGDVLESGIEIEARPPGKKLQSISLLSGGEQTMTAVALLFAIYQVKPSPFCVLDELDAPLDESNINRFVKILQRFLEHSQFVIITHNKCTIGIADVIYGVTMQEQGVSKIMSVAFHQADETSENGDAASVPLDSLLDRGRSKPGANGEAGDMSGTEPQPAPEPGAVSEIVPDEALEMAGAT